MGWSRSRVIPDLQSEPNGRRPDEARRRRRVTQHGTGLAGARTGQKGKKDLRIDQRQTAPQRPDSEEGEEGERRPGLLTESKPNPQSLWRLALGPHLIK